ncbi:hypothetical protein EV426DRAFT_678891 [Tirmania nivea]|nr:hypothetical protein EV426DRAFT_678891 [Tirmania nivea]
MQFSTTLIASLMGIAGTALAAPQFWNGMDNNVNINQNLNANENLNQGFNELNDFGFGGFCNFGDEGFTPIVNDFDAVVKLRALKAKRAAMLKKRGYPNREGNNDNDHNHNFDRNRSQYDHTNRIENRYGKRQSNADNINKDVNRDLDFNDGFVHKESYWKRGYDKQNNVDKTKNKNWNNNHSFNDNFNKNDNKDFNKDVNRNKDLNEDFKVDGRIGARHLSYDGKDAETGTAEIALSGSIKNNLNQAGVQEVAGGDLTSEESGVNNGKLGAIGDDNEVASANDNEVASANDNAVGINGAGYAPFSNKGGYAAAPAYGMGNYGTGANHAAAFDTGAYDTAFDYETGYNSPTYGSGVADNGITSLDDDHNITIDVSQTQTQEQTAKNTHQICEEECYEEDCCEENKSLPMSICTSSGECEEDISVTAIAGDGGLGGGMIGGDAVADIGSINKRGVVGNDFDSGFNTDQNNNQNVNINQNENANQNLFDGFNNFGFFGDEDFGFGNGIFPCFAAEDGFQFDSAVAFGYNDADNVILV